MPYANPIERKEFNRLRARQIRKEKKEKEGKAPKTANPNRKRVGNPNWGKPLDSLMPYPVLPSAFELQVEKLGLKPELYSASLELRAWVRLHYKTAYVPEGLLERWGYSIEVD